MHLPCNGLVNSVKTFSSAGEFYMMIPLSELISAYNVSPRGIIHVGAHEGQELESYLEHNVPEVIWIEANPVICEKLRMRLMPYENHHSYQFAAHERDNLIVQLNVMENTMSSSILYPKKHLEYYPHVPVTEKVDVVTKTLDTFIREENIRMENYNFLNMDIQGAELLTLKGSKENLKYFDYIYTELNTDYLFEGCCLADEMDEFLHHHGFQRVATRMTSDNWGDALYTRK